MESISASPHFQSCIAETSALSCMHLAQESEKLEDEIQTVKEQIAQ